MKSKLLNRDFTIRDLEWAYLQGAFSAVTIIVLITISIFLLTSTRICAQTPEYNLQHLNGLSAELQMNLESEIPYEIKWDFMAVQASTGDRTLDDLNRMVTPLSNKKITIPFVSKKNVDLIMEMLFTIVALLNQIPSLQQK